MGDQRNSRLVWFYSEQKLNDTVEAMRPAEQQTDFLPQKMQTNTHVDHIDFST